MPSSRGSSGLGDRTGSPALQADSLPSEPPGKPAERCVPPLKSVLTRCRPGTRSYPPLPNSSSGCSIMISSVRMAREN